VSVATVQRTRSGAGHSAELVLDGRPQPLREYLAAVWESRGLIATLARKDFFVRYRRASLGMIWAVGLPLLQAVVLTIVFTHVIRVRTSSPYGAFILSGMVAWSYFSSTVVAGSTTVVDNSTMASRIYFPRAVLPLIGVLSNLYGLLISLCILVIVCLVLGVHLGVALLLVLPGIVLLSALAGSLALVTSALHVYFRDMKFLVQALFTVWLYVTPVIYPMRNAPPSLHTALYFNPMTGVVEIFRAATVGADPGFGTAVIATVVAVALLTTAALLLHRRYDRLFTDLL
jgi:ABC-type polysaccharide/polyol phosphate export permease